MKNRVHSEYAADLRSDACEDHLRGELRFTIIESVGHDNVSTWKIIDRDADTSKTSRVLSSHETYEAAEFTAEVLNSWQTERAKLILAAEPTEADKRRANNMMD